MSGPFGWNTQSTNAINATPPATNSSSAQIGERSRQAGTAAIPAKSVAIHVTVPEAANGESSPNSCASRTIDSASSARPATSRTV